MIRVTTYKGGRVAFTRNMTGEEIVKCHPAMLIMHFKSVADTNLALESTPGVRVMVNRYNESGQTDEGSFDITSGQASLAAESTEHINAPELESTQLYMAMLEQFLIDLAIVKRPYMSVEDRHALREARIDWNLRDVEGRMNFIEAAGLDLDYVDRVLRREGYLPQIEWRHHETVTKASRKRFDDLVPVWRERYGHELAALARWKAPILEAERNTGEQQ